MKTSNFVTEQAIQFLSQPELPFGAEEDLLLLSDSVALESRVAELLDEYPVASENGEELKANLRQVDWLFVAQEFRARVGLAATFFDGDAQIIKDENAES